MFKRLFVGTLIGTIILGIFTIFHIFLLPYLVSAIAITMFFFALHILRKDVDALEKELADAKYKIKKLEAADTKKEITDLRYKMKRLEDTVTKKERIEKEV